MDMCGCVCAVELEVKEFLQQSKCPTRDMHVFFSSVGKAQGSNNDRRWRLCGVGCVA